jgi:hypothetical protein
MKKILRRLAFSMLIIFLIFEVGCAKSDVLMTYESRDEVPDLKTPDDFARDIYDLIVYGDLSDDLFYSKKMGVIMAHSPKGWMKDPHPCGLALIPKIDLKLEQLYSYANIPRYFEKTYGRTYRCDAPYKKEFLDNGEVAVSANIVFDSRNFCIEKKDLQKYFHGAIFSESRGGFIMKYRHQERNIVSVEIGSTAGVRQCVSSITFRQNLIEE